MPESCGRNFEESLLSGYVDHALTQGDDQRVRVHLEDCEVCRRTVEEIRELREVTMTTDFALPPDDQWRESPRGGLSILSRGLGWIVLVAWGVGLLGFTLGQVWNGPGSLLEKLLAFGGFLGFALLFTSVLIDRLRAAKTDRYREVER